MKVVLTVLLVSFGIVEIALPQTPFYQDKTISVILGGPPGGSADMRTRAVISLLRKHIPGNPTIMISTWQREEVGRPQTIYTKEHAPMGS